MDVDGCWLIFKKISKNFQVSILCVAVALFFNKKRGSVLRMNFKIKMFVNDFIMSRMVHKTKRKTKKFNFKTQINICATQCQIEE